MLATDHRFWNSAISLAFVLLAVALFGVQTAPAAHASEFNQGGRPSFGGGIIIRIPVQPQRPRCPRGTQWNGRRCIAVRVRECPPGTRLTRSGRCVRIVTRTCGPNMYFSKRRQSCFCRKGFTMRKGRCVTQVACGRGEYFNRRRGSCECRKGRFRHKGQCVTQVACGRGESFNRRSGTCECRKGRFRHKGQCVTQVACGTGGYFDKRRGECRCKRGYRQGSRGCVRPDPVATPTPAITPRPKPTRVARNNEQCLPQDLYELMARTYGQPPAMKPCEAACLPRPAGYTDGQLDRLAQRHGVNWCESCVKLGGFLPLTEVNRIEALAGITLCMSDGWRMCSAPGYAQVDPGVTRTRVREVIRRYPVTLGKQGDIAVVIGNETYKNGMMANSNAQADADAVMTLLTEQLGYRSRNVINLRNASLQDMHRLFGGPDGTPGELQQLFGNRKDGNIFVYLSTHGMTDQAAGKSYLLPVDASHSDLSNTAYGLDELYANLGKIGARTVMLAMEATFGSSPRPFINPPNLPESEIDILPKTAVPGLAVFTASDRDQHTLDDPEFGIGLFTRYLIEGMAGKADGAPTGNTDKQIDSIELHVYTAHMVRMAARKSFGLEQKPLLSKIDNLLIGKLASK